MVLVAPVICTSSGALSNLLTVLDEALEGISESEVFLTAGQEIMRFLDEVIFVGALAETLMFVRDGSLTVLEDVEGPFEVDVVVKTVEHDTIDERVYLSDDRGMFCFDVIYGLPIETPVSNG